MCSVASPSPPSAARPADELSLEQLEHEIAELGAHIAAATCRWLVLIAAFDRRRGWAEWGVKSCADWLSWRCSIAPRSARDHVRVARALEELPLVRQAFAAGELSYSKVRALTRVASPQTEAELVELARNATGGQLDRLVRGYGGVLSATLGRARDTHLQRGATVQWQEDGSLRLQARLSADEGALLLAALGAAEADVVEDPEQSVACAVAARRADALVALARRGLAAPAGARSGGDPCEVVVHVDAQTLAGDAVHERSEVADGPALAPETVRRLGCDAAVVAIVERDGQPLSVGRRTRSVPPALRRALRSRDGGCRFPGCQHRRFLHAHHIRHWARGGPTELANLVQLCSHHHRLVHEGGYGVERGPSGALVFRRPDGRPIPAAPPSPGARGHGLEERNRRVGLAIDARTCRPRFAGDRLDYSIAVEGLIARELAST